jgi:protein-disulfide isomerase
MVKRLEYVTNIILIATCSVLALVLGTRLLAGRPAPPTAGALIENIEDRGLTVAIDERATEGQQTAKLVLIEFSDFQCPYCARHARDTHPQLHREYVATGKVKHLFRNLPLAIHRSAFAAAKAAECAARQNRYWEMHARLFDNQQALGDADLRRHAVAVGLDEAQFVSCFDDAATSARIKADEAEAARLTVTSTPAFFVGVIQPDGTARLLRRVNGAQPYSVFVAALEDVENDAATGALSPRDDSLAYLARAIRGGVTRSGPESCSSSSCAVSRPSRVSGT